jgi:acetoacetyl-CoA synthetase
LPGRRSPSPSAVPFDHPLWVLYSSGTTGLPKAIVHSHGGVVLEREGDRLDVRHPRRRPDVLVHDDRLDDVELWSASMLVDGVPVLYDGSPGIRTSMYVGPGGARR